VREIVFFEPRVQTADLPVGFVRGHPPERQIRLPGSRDHLLGQLWLRLKIPLIGNSDLLLFPWVASMTSPQPS
jgi:hypothetical protein